MKKRIFLSFILIQIFIYTFFADYSHSQWTQTSGPGGGLINAMATSGSNIFTGMYANMGMFYSTNDGSTWIRKTECSYLINTLYAYGGKLFVGTFNNGLYVIQDSGTGAVSHVYVNGLDPCIYCFTSSGNKIFAASVNHIYASSDGGYSWTNTGTGSYTYRTVYSSGSKIYAGTSSSGVFVSSNEGTAWIMKNSGLTTTNVTSITGIGSSIFAATYGGGVYASSNGGDSWTAVNSGLTCNKVNFLFTNGNYLFACTDSAGVFCTLNNGASWSHVFNGIPNTQIYAGCSKGPFVFTGCYASGVFRSSNNGNTWSDASSGMTSQDINGFTYIGSDLFASTSRGIYRSSDNGNTWALKNNGIANSQILTVTSFGNTLYAGCNYGGNHPDKIYRSTNLGVNWSVIMSNPDICVNTILPVGTDLWAGTGSGIYLSTNNGVDWTRKTTSSSYSLIQKGSSLYNGTYGVFRSTDYGNTWSLISPNNLVKAICAYESDIFMASGNNLYKSSNEGVNWISVLSSPINSIKIYGNSIFAFGQNVYVSSNGGVNWVNKTGNLGATSNNAAITNNYVFTGTSYASVWKRPLSDFVWVNCISSEIPSEFALYQNYPNPFNPSTKIKFDVIKEGLVILKIFDVSGKEVAVLVNERLQTGTYEASFNINEISGKSLSSGIYFYTLTAGNFKETRKMILTK